MCVSYHMNRQYFDSYITDHQQGDTTTEAILPVARYALTQLVTFNGSTTLTSLVFESRIKEKE